MEEEGRKKSLKQAKSTAEKGKSQHGKKSIGGGGENKKSIGGGGAQPRKESEKAPADKKKSLAGKKSSIKETKKQKPWVPKFDPAKIPRAELTTPDSFIQSALEAHNFYRAKHDSPPLSINDDLSKIAQAWANKIAEDGKMGHSYCGFGENVYWNSRKLEDAWPAVNNWYNEIKNFDWTSIDHQKGTGHFTQTIWKNTEEFGIACAYSKKGFTFVVANYKPPGNFIGHYKANISKPK